MAGASRVTPGGKLKIDDYSMSFDGDFAVLLKRTLSMRVFGSLANDHYNVDRIAVSRFCQFVGEPFFLLQISSLAECLGD